jgi:hypothetical protein
MAGSHNEQDQEHEYEHEFGKRVFYPAPARDRAHDRFPSSVIDPIHFPSAAALMSANQIVIFQLQIPLGARPRFFVPPIPRKQIRPALIHDTVADCIALEMDRDIF